MRNPWNLLLTERSSEKLPPISGCCCRRRKSPPADSCRREGVPGCGYSETWRVECVDCCSNRLLLLDLCFDIGSDVLWYYARFGIGFSFCSWDLYLVYVFMLYYWTGWVITLMSCSGTLFLKLWTCLITFHSNLIMILISSHCSVLRLISSSRISFVLFFFRLNIFYKVICLVSKLL